MILTGFGGETEGVVLIGVEGGTTAGAIAAVGGVGALVVRATTFFFGDFDGLGLGAFAVFLVELDGRVEIFGEKMEFFTAERGRDGGFFGGIGEIVFVSDFGEFGLMFVDEVD